MLPNADGFGDSGVSVGWDDNWVGGVGGGNSNGDALDGLWVQNVWPNAGWWDLGAFTSKIAVFTSQDHGPYVAEGLEYRVYGAGTLWDDTSLGAQATMTDVYLDGWRPFNPLEDANQNRWSSDDITGVLDLGAAYRYVKIAAWSPENLLNEPEIDAVAGVAPVPEASTFMLFGSGLPGLAWWVRSRRRKAKA